MSAHILHQAPPQTGFPWASVAPILVIGAGGLAVWYFVIPDAAEIADAGRELAGGAADVAVTLGEGVTDVGDDVVDFVADTGGKGLDLAEDIVVDFLGKKVIGGTAKSVAKGIDTVFGRDGWVDNLVQWPWEK